MEQTNETVVIRPVWMPQVSKDGGTIVAELGPLLADYWAERRPPGYGDFEFNVEGFVRAWANRDLIYVEIRVGQVLAGFAFVFLRHSLFCRDRIADIGTVYVAPKWRGRGLMRQAKAHIQDLARTLDIPHLYRDHEHFDAQRHVVTMEKI